MHENEQSKISGGGRRPHRKRKRVQPRKPKQQRPDDHTNGYLAQLDAVIESVHEGLIICDTAGRVRRMNRRALEIHGYASVEEAWQALPEFADAFTLYDPGGYPIPVEDWPLSRAVRGEVLHDVEVRVRNRRTGTEWIGRCDGTPVRDEQGNVVLTVLTLHEFQEPADGAAEELVWRARMPQENPDPVLCISADHVLRYSNPAAEELCRAWGYRQGQKVPAVVRQIVSAALAKGAVTQHEVTFDSRTYWLTAAPSVADGYVNIYARDITDYRRAGEALREAEQKFRTIFDSTSDGIFVLDLETRRFTMCNQSCVQMLGYTQEEFLNLSIPDLHQPDDLPFIYAQIEEFLKGGKPIRHDVRFKRKDGSIVFTDLSPDLVRLDGKRYVAVVLKDITGRKQAEEALQRERDQAREYLRVAGVMIVALDAEGKITLINEKGCEILGYQREEILGRDWFQVCLPEEICAEVTGVFNSLMAGDIAPVEYYENPVLRKDGQQRIVAFHNTVLRDPSSRIVGILFSGEDITARRRAEEARAESERKYRSLVENIPDVTWTTDRQGRTLFISPNVKDVYGYSVEEIYTGSDTWLANVHPDDRPRMERAFHELFTKKKRYDAEYRIRRKDGNWIWLHDRSVSSYEKDGQWYADGVFSDITERKRLEEELRRYSEHLEELVEVRTQELQESETRYRSLYHTIADGIFVMRADGRIDDVNDSACAQLGYTREELTGLPVSAVSAQSDFNLGEIFDRLRATGRLSYETSHRRKDGTLVPVELSVTLVEYRGGPAILGVARDITERQRAESERKKLIHDLEKRIKEMTALYRTMEIVHQQTPVAEFLQEVVSLLPGAWQYPEITAARLRFDGEEYRTPGYATTEWAQSARFSTYDARDGGIDIVYLEPRPEEVEGPFLAEERSLINSLAQILEGALNRRISQEALQFTQFAVDHTADAAFWMTEDGRFIYVNEAACQALGYSRDELLKMTVYDIDPAFTESIWFDRWPELKANKSVVIETGHQARDGRIYPVEVRANYVEFGGREYDCAFARDITERKRTEGALLESEERYRILLDHGFDGIFVHENFRIVQLNDRFADMTGYTRAELLGSQSIDLFAPDSQKRIRQYIRSGASGYFEIELQRRDGRIVDVESYGVPCQFQGRSARIVGLRDITQRKRAAEALRRLNEQLELQVAQRTEELTHTVGRLQQLALDLSQAEDRERKRIAAILHDDVQQTLAAARFQLNLLSNETRSAAQTQEIVEQIQLILRDAIEKSRSLSHELSPVVYQVDLAETLRWLACHMERKHGLTVRVEAHGQVDSASEPLKAFLYRAAQELLFNVAKHAGVKEARIRVRRMGRCIYLSVVDQGRGFDAQKLEGAAGFGLLGIRERVQLLGGRMRIKSTQGMGSKFLIEVPDKNGW